MSRSPATPEPYSRRHFLSNVGLSVPMMAIAGWLVFLFAPEDITCYREGPEVSCQLRRLVADVPVWERRVDGFRIADTGSVDPRQTGVFRRGNVTSQNWVRLWGKGGALESNSSEDGHEVHQAAEALNAMVNSPAQSRVQVRLAGTPSLYPWVVGGFLVGASIVPLWMLGFLVHRLRGTR